MSVVRSFTVFQDAPATPTSKPTPKSKATPSSALRPFLAENAVDATALVDKENVHPLTGERAGPSSGSATKKRKTGVLAAKVVVAPLAVKKQKGLKEKASEVGAGKKRKASTSSSAAAAGKGRTGAKKEGKATSSGSARTTAKRSGSTRKVTQLPKVDEEGNAEKEKERIAQAGIDARCYELTVQPLADVSQAYAGTPSSPLEGLIGDEIKFSVKGSPEIRDYFSLPLGSATRFKAGAEAEEAPGTHAFSTPERKQIYAAFTFASPSPTGERFSRLSRSRSASPLADFA